MLSRVLLAVLLFCVVSVNAGVLYTRTQPPMGWAMVERAQPTDPVEFSIGLKNRNLDKLEEKFWAVSDPQSDEYQNYMTIEEINDLTAPKKCVHDKVYNWLLDNGVTADEITSFPDMFDVRTTAIVAESLFSTKMYVYSNEKEGLKAIKNYGPYSLPAHIHDHVILVAGLSTFPIPKLRQILKKEISQNNPEQSTVVLLAQSLWSLYNVPSNQKPQSRLDLSQGVIEFQGQNYAPSDLSSYAQQVGLQIQTLPNNNIIGPNDPTSPQLESTLDIQMIASVDLQATNWFWLEQGQGWLYQFGNHFMNTQKVPMVNSVSYGWWEGDQCDIDPQTCQQLGVDTTGYVIAVNALFQKIALRGISMLVSSGDSGANGRTDPDCSIPQLRAAYPASSPYVTAVGATQLNNPRFNLNNLPPACQLPGVQCPSGGTEVAVSFDVSQFASGGGFSNIAAMPTYQKAAVNAYLRSGTSLPPSSYYNRTGRAIPDIAAIGHNCLIYTQGQLATVGGTSCSAPINAGIISLLNEVSMQHTKKPLGFLNPLLYQAFAADPTIFNDITVGDNKCTEQGCSSSCQGFLCAKGWDPVTGLGSLNYAKLKSYIQMQAEARAARQAERNTVEIQ